MGGETESRADFQICEAGNMPISEEAFSKLPKSQRIALIREAWIQASSMSPDDFETE